MARYKQYILNLKNIRRGDTFETHFLVDDGILLSECTVLAQVRRQAGDEKLILSLDTVVDGQTLTLKKAHTYMNLPAGTYAYDVQYTFPDGYVFTHFGGSFEIVNDTSR